MKKGIKIALAPIIILFVLLLTLPFVLGGRIESVVKSQINKQVNATVSWHNLSASLLSDFPNLEIEINNLSIVGDNHFAQDTLVAIDKVQLSTSLFELFSSDAHTIKKISIINPEINTIATNDGHSNWDIVKSNSTTGKGKTAEKTTPVFLLEQFTISNGAFSYTDAEDNIVFNMQGVDVSLRGDLSSVQAHIILESSFASLYFKQRNITYLNHSKARFDAAIIAELEKNTFTISDNSLRLNDLEFKFNGSVAVLQNGYDIDASMESTNTDLKALLSMIPESYLADFSQMETTGTMDIHSKIKGLYVDENQLPQFEAILNVEEGSLKHPDSNQTIDVINVRMKLDNPGGSADSTKIDLSSFQFTLANNPFSASFLLQTPISNADFKGKIKGGIDLGALQQVFVVENSMGVDGRIDADIEFSGNMDMIEREDYEAISVDGLININNFSYNSSDLPSTLFIPDAQLWLNSEQVELKKFKCSIGQSDFSLLGILSGHLPYLFNNKMLKGSIQHHSSLLNVNEFSLVNKQNHVSKQVLTNNQAPVNLAVLDTAKTELIVIPNNIDITFSSSFDKIIYDKLEITKASGRIVAKDGKAVLDKFNMNLLDGKVTMTGQYNTQSTKLPFVDFAFEANNIDVQKAANSFSVVDSLMPVAKNAKGKIFSNFKFRSSLNQDMSLNVQSITGGGNVKSKLITVSNSKVLNQMASLLQQEKYKTLKAENIDINFVMRDAKIVVSPFTTKIYGSDFNIRGVQGFDQSLDYVIEAPVSRKDVANAMGFFGGIVNQNGDDILVDVIVKGYANDPKMSLDLAKAQEQLKNEVSVDTQKAIEELLEDDNIKKAVDDIKNKLGDFFK